MHDADVRPSGNMTFRPCHPVLNGSYKLQVDNAVAEGAD
jgi:hypothetical protein